MDFSHFPEYLKESIRQYEDALKEAENGKFCSHIDCDFCNLQSDINAAELQELITPEEAYFLRTEVLGMDFSID